MSWEYAWDLEKAIEASPPGPRPDEYDQVGRQDGKVSIRRHVLLQVTARVEVSEEYYLSLFHNPDRVLRSCWPGNQRQLKKLKVLEESEPFNFHDGPLHTWKV